jgi:hypothetical protein
VIDLQNSEICRENAIFRWKNRGKSIQRRQTVDNGVALVELSIFHHEISAKQRKVFELNKLENC